MANRTHLSLILGTVLLSSCAAPSGPEARNEDESVAEASQALTASPLRWVGQLSADGDCPLPAGSWQISRLFPGAAGKLARYCVAEWPSSLPPPTAADLDLLPVDPTSGTAAPDWLDVDWLSVAALSDPTPTELARAEVASSMFETFLQAMSAPTNIAYGGSYQSVTVAIIDSQPSSGGRGRSSHGFAMSSIVTSLACPGGLSPCPVQVKPYLALNRLADGSRNDTEGGVFGYQSRIAQQVAQATTDWINSGSGGTGGSGGTSGSNPIGKLIINLSLAWDVPFNLNAHNQLSAAARSVQDAIEDARCKGALVLAAAGNASRGQNPTSGPMFPAAWESSPLTCAEASGKPTVRAIGGIDAVGGLMPSARPGAMPVLAADGYLVPAPGDGDPTPPFSGTSVATAAASGVAAALWALSPSASADSIATQLFLTGVPTSYTADVCGGLSSCPHSRRISMCAALGAAASGCRTPPTENPSWTPAQLDAVSAYNDPTPRDRTDRSTLAAGSACEGIVFTKSGNEDAGRAELCPIEVLPNDIIVPFATSQPNVPICGACGLFWQLAPESILEIGLNEELDAPAFPATLTLYDDAGGVTRYDISGDYGLEPGKVYDYKLPGMDGQALKAAVIEWYRVADTETTSDVAIVKAAQ